MSVILFASDDAGDALRAFLCMAVCYGTPILMLLVLIVTAFFWKVEIPPPDDDKASKPDDRT